MYIINELVISGYLVPAPILVQKSPD